MDNHDNDMEKNLKANGKIILEEGIIDEDNIDNHVNMRSNGLTENAQSSSIQTPKSSASSTCSKEFTSYSIVEMIYIYFHFLQFKFEGSGSNLIVRSEKNELSTVEEWKEFILLLSDIDQLATYFSDLDLSLQCVESPFVKDPLKYVLLLDVFADHVNFNEQHARPFKCSFLTINSHHSIEIDVKVMRRSKFEELLEVGLRRLLKEIAAFSPSYQRTKLKDFISGVRYLRLLYINVDFFDLDDANHPKLKSKESLIQFIRNLTQFRDRSLSLKDVEALLEPLSSTKQENHNSSSHNYHLQLPIIYNIKKFLATNSASCYLCTSRLKRKVHHEVNLTKGESQYSLKVNSIPKLLIFDPFCILTTSQQSKVFRNRNGVGYLKLEMNPMTILQLFKSKKYSKSQYS